MPELSILDRETPFCIYRMASEFYDDRILRQTVSLINRQGLDVFSVTCLDGKAVSGGSIQRLQPFKDYYFSLAERWLANRPGLIQVQI